jgi:hypothetical protein
VHDLRVVISTLGMYGSGGFNFGDVRFGWVQLWGCTVRVGSTLGMNGSGGFNFGDVLFGWVQLWGCTARVGSTLGMYCSGGFNFGDVLFGWVQLWGCTVRVGSTLGMYGSGKPSPDHGLCRGAYVRRVVSGTQHGDAVLERLELSRLGLLDELRHHPARL